MAIQNRYEFMYYVACTNCNPNGDPDMGNMPRIDPQTMQGFITDAATKRRIRNYVDMAHRGEPGMNIIIQQATNINRHIAEAKRAAGVADCAKAKEAVYAGRKKACELFYDVRTFGAVMTGFVSAKLNCGQVCGPVQLGFARSIDPIIQQDITITRTAQATEKDFSEKGSHTMGEKFIVPYALYRAHGYISANLARKTTGFSDEDLELLWNAIINMFEYDHSAARGNMAVRKLIIFKHDSELGSAPAHKLFDLVTVKRADEEKPARSFNDYIVNIDESRLPEHISVICKD